MDGLSDNVINIKARHLIVVSMMKYETLFSKISLLAVTGVMTIIFGTSYYSMTIQINIYPVFKEVKMFFIRSEGFSIYQNYSKL